MTEGQRIGLQGQCQFMFLEEFGKEYVYNRFLQIHYIQVSLFVNDTTGDTRSLVCPARLLTLYDGRKNLKYQIKSLSQ